MFFLTYTHGSYVGNCHFIWKPPEGAHENSCCTENLKLVEDIRQRIPVYHTRAMKREFYSYCGRITPKSKPYVLRAIYNALSGDESASRTTAESEMDSRISKVLEMEDSDIIVDLRECDTNGQDCFSLFWEKCNQFLSGCTTYKSEDMAQYHSWQRLFQFAI